MELSKREDFLKTLTIWKLKGDNTYMNKLDETTFFIGDFLNESVSWTEEYISLAAFAGTFIVIIIVISLLGKALTKFADFVSLGIMNKIRWERLFKWIE